MRCFVTGGAGFIGSHLCDRLLADGHEVAVYDNYSTGQPEFLEGARRSARFREARGDCRDLWCLTEQMRGADIVFHLAANADVRLGTIHPRKDLEEGILATFHLLEAMRATGIRRLGFTSTASVYGEPETFPTPENAPFPTQTSIYGAAKLAAEGLIQAYCEGFGLQAFIFRLVSILGERYSHGHVFDLYRQLLAHPDRLHILGDGQQRKSYLDVGDAIDGILLALERDERRVSIFNLGADATCQVHDSVRWICDHLGLSPERTYAGGRRGWVGDSPVVDLDCSRMRALGWRPRVSIREGIVRTLEYLRQNPWLLERRAA